MKNIILRELKKNYPTESLADVKRSFEYLVSVYGDRRRASGQTQVDHALNVAGLLAQWKLSPDLVIAGLLHDILENTSLHEDDLRNKFGQKITRLILGENRLDSLKYWGQERYAENLRRMFMAMADDVQIIFIKFADRIDNLKTLDYLPKEKKKRLATESLEIYAPIANRLGMDKIKRELEDLAFYYLKPQAYENLKKIVDNYHKSGDRWMKVVENEMTQSAKNAGIKIIEINNRIKSLYSFYLKHKNKAREHKAVYDIAACRIIVPNISDCYTMIGIIHRYWKPLPSRFKDYISNPKPNGYQSLHTNVFYEKKILEFQVRTPEMHAEAEYGIAAHWAYKEKEDGIGSNIRRRTAWLKELNEIQKEIKNNIHLPHTTKTIRLDIFRNRIFTITPKGDVIELPESATPLDFAYAVKTELGNHYLKAKVNGQLVSITYRLRPNDSVEIITDRKPTVIKKWLKVATTRLAINEIKSFLKIK